MNNKKGIFSQEIFRTNVKDPTLGWKAVIGSNNKCLSTFANDAVQLLQMYCS